jgi:transposase
MMAQARLRNRQVTVFGAIEVTTGRWVYRLGRRRAADFIAFLRMLAEAFPRAAVIVVICDNDSIHHARTVTTDLEQHPRLELLYGARYSPHDNPAEMSLSQCEFRRAFLA